MDANTRAYCEGLTVKRLLAFIKTTYGVNVYFTLALVPDERFRPTWFCTASLLSLVEKLELSNPPQCVLTARLTDRTTPEGIIKSCLMQWLTTLEEHLAETNRPD